MSGPVFVLDASEQPLMPLAAANARKLLRTAKARRWPHPTLTVIQLTRTVERPILRPVLLGLAIHPTAAELFVLAAGPHAVFPLLSIVVDLPRRLRWGPRRTARRRQRRRRPMWKQILEVGSVISTLWEVLPLSHIAIIRTPALQAAAPGILRRLRRYLAAGGIQVAVTTLDGVAPPAFPHDLFAFLPTFVLNPAAYAPVIIACHIVLPQNRTRLTRRIDDADADDPDSDIGEVTTPPLLGIIDPESTDQEQVLRVPVAADASGVTWRYVAIAPPTPVRRWPSTPAVLLPLVPRTVQEAVTLLENRWDA